MASSSTSLPRDDPGPLPRSDADVIQVRAVPDADDDTLMRRVAEAHVLEYRTQKLSYHHDDLTAPRGTQDKGTNMPVGQPLFLGFKSVGDLVARRPLRDRVFYFPVVEQEADSNGTGVATHRLIVSALLNDGLIGYVSFDLARDAILGGRRVVGPDGEASDPSSRVNSAVEHTRTHLAELGIKSIEAVLARPRSYVYLSVVPAYLDYDKTTDSFTYRRAEVEGG